MSETGYILDDEERRKELESVSNNIRTLNNRIRTLTEQFFKTYDVNLKIQIEETQQDLAREMERLDQLQQVAAQAETDRAVSVEEPDFTFANRQEELSFLTDPDTKAPLFLVEGPAGQGKTYLLQQVAKRFQKSLRTRVYSYTFKDPVIDTSEFLWDLLKNLDIQRANDLESGLDSKELQEALIPFFNDERYNLTVLIFDAVENLDKKSAVWLRDEIFYQLGEMEGVRIIVSGRYLTANPEQKWPGYRGAHKWNKPLTLSELGEEVIAQVIDDYLRRKNLSLKGDLEAQRAIAHNVHQIAGGHPGFIIKVLNRIQKDVLNLRMSGQPALKYCHRYFRNSSAQLFKEVVRPELDQIFENVHDEKIEHLRHAFEMISVFRHFAITALDVLIRRGYLKGFNRGLELIQRLSRTGLIVQLENAPGFYRDNIIRNLLFNYVRIEQPDIFQELNELAVTLYQSLAQGYLIGPADKRRKMEIAPQGDVQMKLIIESIYHQLVLLNAQAGGGPTGEYLDRVKEILAEAINLLIWSDLEAVDGAHRFNHRLENDSEITSLLISVVGSENYGELIEYLYELSSSGS